MTECCLIREIDDEWNKMEHNLRAGTQFTDLLLSQWNAISRQWSES